MKVASFWDSGNLSYFERVCIQSFLDNGAYFRLYVRSDVGNVPNGVDIRDSKEIFDAKLPESDDKRFNAGVFSDIFRAYLMEKTEFIWVDTDIVCVRPLDFVSDYYFGVIYRKQTVNNCVLRLPKQSPALRLMLNFFESKVPIPFWWREAKLRPLLENYKRGILPTLTNLPWTTTGPNLLSWALRSTGEINNGQNWTRYYQYESALNHEYLVADCDVNDYEPPHAYFVHLYGSTKIHLAEHFNGIPPDGSYVDIVCKRHNVSPADYPIMHVPGNINPKPNNV